MKKYLSPVMSFMPIADVGDVITTSITIYAFDGAEIQGEGTSYRLSDLYTPQ